MKKSKAASFFDRKVNPETEAFVGKSLAVADQIATLMEVKGMTQKELARKLGKTESEVSKWLSGMHNLTLKSIVKMELALGETILQTPLSLKQQQTSSVVSKVDYPPTQQGWDKALKVTPAPETFETENVKRLISNAA